MEAMGFVLGSEFEQKNVQQRICISVAVYRLGSITLSLFLAGAVSSVGSQFREQPRSRRSCRWGGSAQRSSDPESQNLERQSRIGRHLKSKRGVCVSVEYVCVHA